MKNNTERLEQKEKKSPYSETPMSKMRIHNKQRAEKKDQGQNTLLKHQQFSEAFNILISFPHSTFTLENGEV